jgi:hypothetical protein
MRGYQHPSTLIRKQFFIQIVASNRSFEFLWQRKVPPQQQQQQQLSFGLVQNGTLF